MCYIYKSLVSFAGIGTMKLLKKWRQKAARKAKRAVVIDSNMIAMLNY